MRYLLLLCLFFAPTAFFDAQVKPLTCRLANGEEIFVREDWNSNRFSLVSWTSGVTLFELAKDFPVTSFKPVEWSPYCRYLLAEIGRDDRFQVAVWETSTGALIGILDDTARLYRLNWSPDEIHLAIQLRNGGYLWYLPTNQQTLLNSQVDNYGRSFYSVEWDTERNQLLVVKIGSGNGVNAYDLNSQQEVGFFHIGDFDEHSAPVTYRRYENNRYLIVYSMYPEVSNGISHDALAIWDRDTLQHILLNPNYDNFGLSYWGGFDISGNLYSRYFIIADYGLYYGHLYVWDLHNLIGTAPYIPNFQYTLSQGGEMRFIDEHTLEVAYWTIWAYSHTPYTLQVIQVELDTGKLLFASPQLSYTQCNDDVASYFEWACEVASDETRQIEIAGANLAKYWLPR